METVFETFLEHFQKLQQSANELWNKSKYFRIVSLVTGTLAASLTIRNFYVKMHRKFHHLPHGPLGIPFLGQSMNVFDPNYLAYYATNYGVLTSLIMGPYDVVIVNEPHLAKQLYSDPRTVNIPPSFSTEIDRGFATLNGKSWAERRKIIYANLMTTMKASYVEDTTKQFIKNKVFPAFDENIRENKPTTVRSLFRPIGFNIVLQACFGKQLTSLSDEYWLKYDKQSKEALESSVLQSIIFVLFGNNTISTTIQRLLTGSDFLSIFDVLINVIDGFTKNQSRDIQFKKDDGVKLFNDYVEDYVNSKDGAKWTRRQLISDMSMMFLAATDTTYAALAFTLLLAAKYPAIQDEIHEEIVAAYGDCVDDIELRHQGITKIPKLRALIHESLRLFPPIPIAGFRQILDDGVTLKTNDTIYDLPKSTMIAINVCGIAQNPQYWIDDYDPVNNEDHKNVDMKRPHLDFWMDETGRFSKKKNSSSFFSFHIGKRDCVGQALAMKEMMIVLSMIFMKYKVMHPEKKTDFEIGTRFSVVLEPSIGDIRFEPR